MPEIVTDQEILFKKSEPANDLEIGDIIQQLSITIPDHALGLAAPQIGIHKRVFLANLSSGSYAFINPEITWESPQKVPSEESCLSLPGIRRCIERHERITVSAHKLIDMKTGDVTVDPEPMSLKDLDSKVVQHENDHLNGVLILNHPLVASNNERVWERKKNRYERITKARLEKKNKQPPPSKIQKFSAKNLAKKKRDAEKIKRQKRTARRQDRIRVEIQERHKAEKKGLFSDDTSPASDAVNKPEQD